MQTLSALDRLPSGSLECGIELLNKMRWHIRVTPSSSGTWVVLTGHSVLLRTDSRETVDAFLYGMALSHASLPPKLQDDYRAFMLASEGYDANNPPGD